jgi:hypothetical protein
MSRLFPPAPLEQGLPDAEEDEEIIELEGEEDFEGEFREAEDADARYASAGQES